jgi:hypothetical protein
LKVAEKKFLKVFSYLRAMSTAKWMAIACEVESVLLGSEYASNIARRYFGDDNFIRVAHALETLTVLLREIFKKRFNEQVCSFLYQFNLCLFPTVMQMSDV